MQEQKKEEQGTNEEKSNASLQGLRLDIEGIVPNFTEDVFKYYITIPNDIENLEVLAISKNPNSKVEVSGNTNLKEGLNNITILITSEDGTNTKTYNIEVTKTANLEIANTNLETLAIENALISPPFDNSEVNYKTEVSDNIERINILAIPENENAKVEIMGADNLKEGNNIITILVTAQNGFTKKKYQVQVYKRNKDEQKKYNEEQSDMQNKLDEAYEIEKLSTNETENKQHVENGESNNNMLIILGVLFVGIIVVLIIVMRFKFLRK